MFNYDLCRLPLMARSVWKRYDVKPGNACWIFLCLYWVQCQGSATPSCLFASVVSFIVSAYKSWSARWNKPAPSFFFLFVHIVKVKMSLVCRKDKAKGAGNVVDTSQFIIIFFKDEPPHSMSPFPSCFKKQNKNKWAVLTGRPRGETQKERKSRQAALCVLSG